MEPYSFAIPVENLADQLLSKVRMSPKCPCGAKSISIMEQVLLQCSVSVFKMHVIE